LTADQGEVRGKTKQDIKEVGQKKGKKGGATVNGGLRKTKQEL